MGMPIINGQYRLIEAEQNSATTNPTTNSDYLLELVEEPISNNIYFFLKKKIDRLYRRHIPIGY